MQPSLASLVHLALTEHAPTHHPLFALIAADRLEASEMAGIGLDVYHVTAAFPRFLAALAARIEDVERRAPWVENLHCEQGGADPRRSHLASYRRFLNDVGVPDAAVAVSRPELPALCYTRALFDLCATQPLPEARAALSIIEDIVARVSPTLVAYARAHSRREDAGQHFATHAELDQAHAEASYRESERDWPDAPALVERGLALGLHYQWQLYSHLVECHVAHEKWRDSGLALRSPALRFRLPLRV